MHVIVVYIWVNIFTSGGVEVHLSTAEKPIMHADFCDINFPLGSDTLRLVLNAAGSLLQILR